MINTVRDIERNPPIQSLDFYLFTIFILLFLVHFVRFYLLRIDRTINYGRFRTVEEGGRGKRKRIAKYHA